MSLTAYCQKMQQAGLVDWQIKNFIRDFKQLQNGLNGFIAEKELKPLNPLPRLQDLPVTPRSQALAQTVIIKLNGGLGTSMGLELPKSLLQVRQGLSFLDLTRMQLEYWRQLCGHDLPLLLLNSFHTREASLQHLQGFSNRSLPLDFLQSKIPKIRQDNLEPVEFPSNPHLEWCPPGHGEIYALLRHGGMLEQLLEAGYRYAFVSNIDNLGATLEPTLLSWFYQNKLDLAMEVTLRTDLDKKGGHLARLLNNHLILRERSQCCTQELPLFEDIQRHSYFNTNNLWLRLESLYRQPVPRLPLIINKKTIDPTDVNSTPVYQLESAMGAAIDGYKHTQAIEVPRTRFLPVKTLADLLLLRSDLYQLNQSGHLQAVTDRQLPKIYLDQNYYSTYKSFQERFSVIPSLLKCCSLRVQGDIYFKDTLTLEGDINLSNPKAEPIFLP